LGAMEAAANGSFAFGSVCFLGEARRTDIEQLEREYRSEYLEVCVVDRNGGRLSYVPAWMFDLPERAYAWRVELRERLAALPALPWDTIKLAGVNPLPAYLAAGLRLPDAWSEALPGWQRYLFDRILPVDGVRATLP